MAKKRRIYFGKILKGADGKPDFMAIDKDITFKEGDFVNLESKKQRIDDINQSVEAGRLTEDVANDLLQKVNKISDRVRFSLYVVRDN